jgi:hypothetical protein
LSWKEVWRIIVDRWKVLQHKKEERRKNYQLSFTSAFFLNLQKYEQNKIIFCFIL